MRKRRSEQALLFCGLLITAFPAMIGAQAHPAADPAPLCDVTPLTVDDAFHEIISKTRKKSEPCVASDPCTAKDEKSNHSKEIQLDEVLTVEVQKGLPGLLAQLAQPACKGKQLVLYLNGRPIPNLEPSPKFSAQGNRLYFTLTPTEASKDAWSYLLGYPGLKKRQVRVSIGLADGYAFPSCSIIQFDVLPHGRLAVWSLLFAAIVIAFFYLAANSNVLRDSVSSSADAPRRSFSLARTQAAWWFFIVLGSYLLIGLVTGDVLSSITGSVLALLGISAGTVVGGAIIDASRPTPVAAPAVLAVPVDPAGPVVPAVPAIPAVPVVAAVPAAPAVPATALRGKIEEFFVDILSDAEGVSFHRFQNVAWSVVLGIIFGCTVYRTLAMPDFDNSLLALMGISAGTYLAAKTTEPKVPTP